MRVYRKIVAKIGVSRTNKFLKNEMLWGMADATSRPDGRRSIRYWGQGRPSKGNRTPTATVLPRPVWEWADKESLAYGKCGVSQVVADVVSIRAGYPELVLYLNRERIDTDDLFAQDAAAPADSESSGDDDVEDDNADVDVMTRLPVVVRTWVDQMTEAYDTSLKQILADIMCEAAGQSDLILKMNKPMVIESEGLPLAI